MKKKISTIIIWLQYHEQQLLGIIAVSILVPLSFVFGALKGAELSQEPIIVMRPQSAPIVIRENSTQEVNILKQKDCIYVGSTKGKKYYPPSCSFAKRISKENLRCFVSDEDAIDKGYEKSTSCK